MLSNVFEIFLEKNRTPDFLFLTRTLSKWLLVRQGEKVCHFLPQMKFNQLRAEMTLYCRGIHMIFCRTFALLKIHVKLSQNQNLRVSTLAVTKIAFYKQLILFLLVVSLF
jgi:hypothetical protein